MRDIIKGFLIGMIAFSILVAIPFINLYYMDIIASLGGFDNLAIISIYYGLVYSWPLLLIAALLWFCRGVYRRVIKLNVRRRKIFLVHIK